MGALRHNVEVIRQSVPAGTGIMAVVKANAYGHGTLEVARALRGRVEMFGVANLAEGLELRAADPETPVFVLGPAMPEERPSIVQAGFIPAISGVDEARAYGAIAPGKVHLSIDTGMGRMGVGEEEAVEVVREIVGLGTVELAGIATHLPSADEDEVYTREQIARFEAVLARVREAGLAIPQIHCLNSAGILRFGDHGPTMVRAGLMLYGQSPLPEFQSRLRPVLSFKTRVALVRELGPGHGVSYGRTFTTDKLTRVATLPVGYADGYRRHLSNRGTEVLIRGRRLPVLGRVTMDQIMVDATALPDLAIGEEVVLIGRQGAGEITAAELAARAGTIPWEIFTGIGRRVERISR